MSVREWTTLEEHKLRILYGSMTNAELSAMLGRSIGSVTGKADRLGLVTKVRVAKPRWLYPKRSRHGVAATKGVALDNLTSTMCRYPYGTLSPYLFCGEPTKGTYCDKHYAACHVPSKNLERK